MPNGTELLGLSYEDTIPEDVRFCMQDCRAAQDFVKKLLQNPEMLEKYRADVEYVDSKRQQRDTLRKDKLDLGKRIREALRMVEAGEVDAELLYVAEMRLKQEAPHPIGGEKVKTICQRDVKDVLGPLVSWTLRRRLLCWRQIQRQRPSRGSGLVEQCGTELQGLQARGCMAQR